MGKGSDVPEYSEDQPDSEVYYHCTYYYPTPPKIDLKKKGVARNWSNDIIFSFLHFGVVELKAAVFLVARAMKWKY